MHIPTVEPGIVFLQKANKMLTLYSISGDNNMKTDIAHLSLSAVLIKLQVILKYSTFVTVIFFPLQCLQNQLRSDGPIFYFNMDCQELL